MKFKIPESDFGATASGRKYLREKHRESKKFNKILWITIGSILLFVFLFKDYDFMNYPLPKETASFCAIIVGIFFLFLLFRSILLPYKAKKWPKVLGKIISVNIVSESGRSGTYYFPQIVYEFNANNKKIIGEGITLSDKGSSRSNAVDTASTYKLNQRVQIFYNPNNPEQTALDIDYNMGYVFTSIFFTIFSFVCALLLYVYL